MNDFTTILHAAASGEAAGAEALLPAVYRELRRVAAARMAGESAAHTLQPTALVHEAWLRMVSGGDRDWRNRAYFFSAASTAMRRILVEHARRRHSRKRGGARERVELDDLELVAPAPDEKLLLVDEALACLETAHPQWARVVVMKYFGGMTHAEIAAALGIGERSVNRHWMGARAWLYREIHPEA